MLWLNMNMVCVGCGGAFILPMSYIVINQYFREKRSVAFSISTMGMGIGSLVLAPFLAFTFDYYGYHGTFLLMGGMFLHLQVGNLAMDTHCSIFCIYKRPQNNMQKTDNRCLVSLLPISL